MIVLHITNLYFLPIYGGITIFVELQVFYKGLDETNQLRMHYFFCVIIDYVAVSCNGVRGQRTNDIDMTSHCS